MFERMRRRQPPSLPIRRDAINDAAEGAGRGIRVSGGLRMHQIGDQILISSVQTPIPVTFKTAGTITARSGTTAGSGPVQIVVRSGSTYQTLTGNVTAYNPTTQSFTTGKYGTGYRVGDDIEIQSMEC